MMMQSRVRRCERVNDSVCLTAFRLTGVFCSQCLLSSSEAYFLRQVTLYSRTLPRPELLVLVLCIDLYYRPRSTVYMYVLYSIQGQYCKRRRTAVSHSRVRKPQAAVHFGQPRLKKCKACITIAIRLRHDYDEKLTCSFFARVESRRIGSRRAR